MESTSGIHVGNLPWHLYDLIRERQFGFHLRILLCIGVAVSASAIVALHELNISVSVSRCTICKQLISLCIHSLMIGSRRTASSKQQKAVSPSVVWAFAEITDRSIESISILLGPIPAVVILVSAAVVRMVATLLSNTCVEAVNVVGDPFLEVELVCFV